MFVFIRCQTCGRTLRAARSPEKTTIRCWDCGADVTVPRFRSSIPVKVESPSEVETPPVVESLAAALMIALVTTSALIIPRFGWVLGLAVLSFGGVLYIRRIEEEEEEEEEENAFQKTDEAERIPLSQRVKRWSLRVVVGAVLAVGLCLPFLLGDGSRQESYVKSPLEGPIHYGIATALWFALPLLVVILFAKDRSNSRLGLGGVGTLLRLRPWSLLAALLMFPLTLAVLEGSLLLGLSLAEWLSLFVYDLFPLSEGMRLVGHTLMIRDEFYVAEPSDAFAFYLDGLQRGATLTGGIPQSIRRGLSPRITPVAFTDLSREGYLLCRIVLTLAILAVSLSVLALQSEWLTRLARSVPSRDEAEANEDQS